MWKFCDVELGNLFGITLNLDTFLVNGTNDAFISLFENCWKSIATALNSSSEMPYVSAWVCILNPTFYNLRK